jgi:hypothetical protein
MDRANQNVTLEAGIARGALYHGTETVSDIAARYDQSLSFWGGAWGSRMRVGAAINGSFFNTGTSEPVGGMVTAGWYARRFDNLAGGSGFTWGMKRDVFMGECVNHRPERQLASFEATGQTVTIDGLNVPLEEDALVLYTPQYGEDTGASGAVEVVVEMLRPAMIIPQPRGATGFIRQVREGLASAPLAFDTAVLSARGAAADALRAAARPGDTVLISQEITHYKTDCETPNDHDWSNVYTSLGGSYIYLYDGEVMPDNDPASPRHPRTAVAYNDSYIFFIVDDGRRPDITIGMTMTELGEFSRDSLGAQWGMAQDGGGSSTLVVNGKVMNNPVSACYTTFLPFVAGPAEPQPQSGQLQFPQEGLSGIYLCQRPVANALMMVELLPAVKSSTFTIGDQVSAVNGATVRLGPGSGYGVLAQVQPGAQGVILPHANDMEGILARGTYWWKVAFGETTGWVAQEELTFVRAAPPGQE